MKGKEKSLKLVLIGNTTVGKTSILTRYFDNKFNGDNKSTLGIEFKTTIINKNGNNFKLQIWDTTGQERFKSITQNYFRDADGLLFIFDVTNKESFDSLSEWIEISNNSNSKKYKKILIGNKIDLRDQRIIDEENDIKPFEKTYDIDRFLEVSAKTGENITKIFDDIAELFNEEDETSIFSAKPEKESENLIYHNDLNQTNKQKEQKRKGCCCSCCCCCCC